MTTLNTYAKAVVGALVAGGGAIATALEDGAISAQEGVLAGVAFLVALGVVWAVPNAPADPPA